MHLNEERRGAFLGRTWKISMFHTDVVQTAREGSYINMSEV